jgi:RES domain-containing protein
MQAWKVGKAALIEDLTGAGPAKSGGRWNHPDHPALYLSLNPAAAALERVLLAGEIPRPPLTLMHLQLPGDPALYREVPPEQLPAGWNALPADQASMDFGTRWLECGEQLGLILPSLAMEQTHCLIINPLHPAAGEIRILRIDDIDPGKQASAATTPWTQR